MMASRAKTLEQHPPKIRASMAPTASHCGMVSMKMRPSMPMILEDMGLWSSMPWISAFSREGAALITLGVMGAEAAACCWAFWREEGCRRRVGRVVIYTGSKTSMDGGRVGGRALTRDLSRSLARENEARAAVSSGLFAARAETCAGGRSVSRMVRVGNDCCGVLIARD